MLHSYIRVYIHYVWATKRRQPILTATARPQIRYHILEYATRNLIEIDSLNVQIDHVHALVALKSDQNIDFLIKLIKGESSHWINSNDLLRLKFSWQRGYGAFSVDYSQLNMVRNYIAGQDEHHRRKSFLEEYSEALEAVGLRYQDDDLWQNEH